MRVHIKQGFSFLSFSSSEWLLMTVVIVHANVKIRKHAYELCHVSLHDPTRVMCSFGLCL